MSDIVLAQHGRDARATLPGGSAVRARPEQPKITKAERAAIMRSESKHLGGASLGRKAVIRGGRITYVQRDDYIAELDGADEAIAPAPKKPRKPRTPRLEHDPKYVAAARELRDRYLEQVNTDRMLPAARGKYDVSRQIEAAPMSNDLQLTRAPHLLEQRNVAGATTETMATGNRSQRRFNAGAARP